MSNIRETDSMRIINLLLPDKTEGAYYPLRQIDKGLLRFGLEFNPLLIAGTATTSGIVEEEYFSIVEEKSIISTAFQNISRIGIPDVALRAKEFLRDFENLIKAQQIFNEDFLPSLHLFPVDDGSALIEWIFNTFRIGFSIDINPSESSWYLVTKKELGQINACGYLCNDNNKVIHWLLHFISDNVK
ncbi:hypothetical protein ACFL5H_02790 [Candidatus Latescibacterota bacterium]